MRPGKNNGQILENQTEITAAINACALEDMVFTDTLCERAADTKHLHPASREVELEDFEVSAVLWALERVAKRRFWQEGADYRKKAAKQVLASYNEQQT